MLNSALPYYWRLCVHIEKSLICLFSPISQAIGNMCCIDFLDSKVKANLLENLYEAHRSFETHGNCLFMCLLFSANFSARGLSMRQQQIGAWSVSVMKSVCPFPLHLWIMERAINFSTSHVLKLMMQGTYLLLMVLRWLWRCKLKQKGKSVPKFLKQKGKSVPKSLNQKVLTTQPFSSEDRYVVLILPLEKG